MVQLAPSSSRSAFGHNSYVPSMQYAYDVNARNGLVTATIKIDDINNTPIVGVEMGQSIICPVDTGACVISATGGAISGYDMYGQYVRETVAAAGTTKIAFASILSSPADALWVNKFGLPYKYSAASSPAMTVATITASAADGDARGTFVATVAPTAPTTITLSYLTDLTNMMGNPYATRFASAEPGSATLAVTAVYVPATRVVTVTVPASTPAGVKTTITFPDGHTVRGVAGTPVVHTLSPIWASQYVDVIDADAADRQIAVGFDGGVIAGTYATVTGFPGALLMGAPVIAPVIAPEDDAPDVTQSWDDMTTHAALNDFVQHWVDDHGVVLPDDWDGKTLAAKKRWLNENVDPTP